VLKKGNDKTRHDTAVSWQCAVFTSH